MKKVLIFVVMLLSAALFVFAACEEKEEEKTEQPSQPDPSPAHEVTSQEWDSAFDESIFENISYTQTITIGDPESADAVSFSTDFQIVREEDRYLIAAGDLRYEVTPDAAYIYQNTDGTWTKNIYDGGFNYDFCYFMCLKGMYESFADCYDPQSQSYTAQNITATISSPTPCESVSVKFTDKKVTSVTFLIAEKQGKIECGITYGQANVILPVEYTDETQNAGGMDDKG